MSYNAKADVARGWLPLSDVADIGGRGVRQMLILADIGGRGVWTPPFLADVICEQPLSGHFFNKSVADCRHWGFPKNLTFHHFHDDDDDDDGESTCSSTPAITLGHQRDDHSSDS